MTPSKFHPLLHTSLKVLTSTFCSSPVDFFGAEHPGGLYNPPRGALDLYTPRFVKGKGVEKVGLCPICVEPYERGGENKRLWLAMKFSAFKWYCLFPLLWSS